MEVIEIIVIIFLLAFFSFIIGNYIYKKKNHLPTGECSCCSKVKRQSNLVKMYHRDYKKNGSN